LWGLLSESEGNRRKEIENIGGRKGRTRKIRTRRRESKE